MVTSETQHGHEDSANKERITTAGIKQRVMELFGDADLAEMGKSQVGPMTVETSPYGSEKARHTAEINGFTAAEYLHLTPEAATSPLKEGQYTASYTLRGMTTHGEPYVRLTEYRNGDPSIEVSLPLPTPMPEVKKGSLDIFDPREQNYIAELLGISVMLNEG